MKITPTRICVSLIKGQPWVEYQRLFTSQIRLKFKHPKLLDWAKVGIFLIVLNLIYLVSIKSTVSTQKNPY